VWSSSEAAAGGTCRRRATAAAARGGKEAEGSRGLEVAARHTWQARLAVRWLNAALGR
jgi:hypothetical protein